MLRPRRLAAIRMLPSHLTWRSRPIPPRTPFSTPGLNPNSRTTLTRMDSRFLKARLRTNLLPGPAIRETTSNTVRPLLKALFGLNSNEVLSGSWTNSALEPLLDESKPLIKLKRLVILSRKELPTLAIVRAKLVRRLMTRLRKNYRQTNYQDNLETEGKGRKPTWH